MSQSPVMDFIHSSAREVITNNAGKLRELYGREFVAVDALIEQNIVAGARMLLKRAIRIMGVELRGGTLYESATTAARVCAPIEDVTDEWVEQAHIKYGLSDVERDIMVKAAQLALKAFRELGGDHA